LKGVKGVVVGEGKDDDDSADNGVRIVRLRRVAAVGEDESGRNIVRRQRFKESKGDGDDDVDDLDSINGTQNGVLSGRSASASTAPNNDETIFIVIISLLSVAVAALLAFAIALVVIYKRNRDAELANEELQQSLISK
jgi:hypothetical protein